MSSCGCQTINVVLPPRSCPDSGTYTAENINVLGEGVFAGKVANNFQFFGITNEDGTIDITLDADNKAIVVNLNAEIAAGSVPDATETVKGKAELATQAESNAGTDDARIVTPLKLATRQATTSLTGLVELATVAESITGTDTVRAVTPAGLKGATNLIPTTLVAANAVARGNTTPSFAGQLLLQLDTQQIYFAGTTSMGDFYFAAIPTDGNIAIGTVNVTAGIFTFSGSSLLQISGNISFTSSSASLQIDGGDIDARSILGTSSTAGEVEAYPISDFVSTYNTENYTSSSSSTRREVPDAGSTTLPELCDIVATLIVDLYNKKKPNLV